jgi:hypothetical protein
MLSPETTDKVSFAELKRLAKDLLPAKSALRSLILSEPDEVPRAEALVKLTVYSRLLYSELYGTWGR